MAPLPKEGGAPAPEGCSEEICISGIAGYFPNSYSVQHLADNLFNKVDLISDDDRRWYKSHPEIPQRTGKVYNVEKFDASFFGVNFKEAHAMNALARLLLERAYECLIDAGVNPSELRNTRTGVFIGACTSENEKMWIYEKLQIRGDVGKGIFHSLVANSISQWLGVKGPSYTVDTACSSSFFALDQAFKSIRDGHCNAAIVGGVNLCLHPSMSLMFYRMGILSDDGRCKSFDNRANGYARSESIVACYLQKAKDSRRIYAKLVHTKTNCDGYKMEGISYPAGHVQKQLLEHFYQECGVSPSTVEFLEAHGTGTAVGDPEELGAIDDIFCKNRKEPLLLGSIKSNLGHSEASSGTNSLAKACIAYNTGYLPPNINFVSPREECPGLMEGRLKVVTEKMPWKRGRFGMSSFGFGGANAHILLENFSKTKVNNGLPSDGIPRLVCVSGRSEAAVSKILEDLESRPVDVDYVRLWHSIHEKNISGHDFRGYIMLDSTKLKNISLFRGIECILDKPKQRPVVFKYTDIRDHWPAVARQCLILPTFFNAISRCSSALKSKGVDLIRLFNESVRQQEFATLGAASVYIGLTDVLKAVGIKPHHVVDNDSGELNKLCNAYTMENMTIEQTILAAYELDTVRNKLAEKHPKRSSSTTDKLSSILPKASAIVIEIGLHEEFSDCDTKRNGTYIAMIGNNKNHVESVLAALGRLFVEGLNPSLANIYPAVEFPVAQGTPMMSHLVEWNHSDDWTVADFRDFFVMKVPLGQTTVKFYMADEQHDYLRGHTIDDRVIFPATGYLQLVWEAFACMNRILYSKFSVVFEDVYLQRATNIPKDGVLQFTITIHSESGKFEITENKTSIVTGRIRKMNETVDKITALKKKCERNKEEGPCEMLTARDFYKELNIRGYQYKGLFRGVRSCTVDGTRGQLSWDNNWITFLDTVLQVKIVSQDTRVLYVPTRIEKIIIDADKHSQLIADQGKDGGDMSLEFVNIPEIDMTRAGGVEVRGIHVSSISKKPPRGIPVLEKNLFIANYCHTQMTLSDVLRCNLQIIHENIQSYKFKTIELVDEDYKAKNILPISEDIADILADLPLVQAEMLVLSNDPLTLPPNITVANKKITGEANTVLFVGANLLKRENVLQEAFSTLKNQCFVLTRENTFNFGHIHPQYDVITVFFTETEYFVLLRSKICPKPTKYIKIDSRDLNFSWIDVVKSELRKEHQRLVLYSEAEPVNGLLGLVNCLRKEPGGEVVRGLLIADPSAPPFTADCNFYKEHLDKGLALNVFKNGQWGTYRHTLLEELATKPTAHAYVNTATIGDLNSLRYFEGQHSEGNSLVDPSKMLVHVYCSALNFRDAMTALGRVTVDSVARGRLSQECVQGLEVSGRTLNGTRVMGICTRGISNLVEGFRSLFWPIPDHWTFEEAATIPVAYMTVYTALVLFAKIRRGEKILIHAGSGGVGQAAINVALHYGLEVFTTVGTPAKRKFIKRLFPQLKDSHIGNSRDTSFEHMIRRETNGEGVDVVLNSLADEKLQASVKCLRRSGRFLEIGKYDITMNTQIEMCFLQKEISFHSVMLDFLQEDNTSENCKTLEKLLIDGIRSGAVRPLTHCSFDKYDFQTAYRYMAAGRHIGKVIIKMREEETCGGIVKPKPEPIQALPRYMCGSQEVYVLVGGLGGFGLELADWLVLRGARNLVISSRRGVSKGYQSLRIRIWKSYGVKLEICTHDVSTASGCEEMLKMAAAMGPVRAIFNLAVVLNDAVFQNQTSETFGTSFRPKALTTIYLDQLSRIHCPHLKEFVIFSSVSCGRGNAGQTNYGFSNSVMERICEERKKEGLPALAIQWGAIGDVGLVADMQEENVQLEIGGTLQQRITSCLQVLDKFLKQDAAVVSSIVVAEKRSASAGADSIADVIAHILGISDVKSISQQAPLSEMGMDSVMAVEIKQTLERDYELFLTAQEIRLMTFAKLTELVAKDTDEQVVTKTSNSVATHDDITAAGLDMFVRKFGDGNTANEPYIIFNSNENKLMHLKDENILFMLPGIESCASTLKTLCGQVEAKTCVLQLGLDYLEDLEQAVNKLYKTVKPSLRPGAPFFLLGYSFGSMPVLKLAARLESEGHKGIVFCLDGSPDYMKMLVNEYLKFSDDDELQNYIICHSFGLICPNVNANQVLMNKLRDIKSFEDRIKCAIAMVPTELNYTDEFMLSSAKVIFDRIKMVINQDSNTFRKINAPIVLLRGKKIPLVQKCNETYGLDKFTTKTVSVHYIDANHSIIPEKKECAEIINRIFNDYNEEN